MDIVSLAKYKDGLKYLLIAIDLFSRYFWVCPSNLKDISVWCAIKVGFLSYQDVLQDIVQSYNRPNASWKCLIFGNDIQDIS